MKKAFLLILLCWCAGAFAAQVQVKGVRLWAAPDNTRVVFDITQTAEHKLFTLSDPDRLVVDLKNTKLNAPLTQPKANDPLIGRLRSAVRNGTDLRIVLDLKTRVRPKSFLLRPNRSYGHRFVLDLRDAAKHNAKRRQDSTAPRVSQKPKRLREVVIAIDAGHGGEDPGAKGRRGTYEKDVVFAVAKRLEELLRKEPGMRPVMTRTGDYYIGLRQRIELARQKKADLFLSIHADAFRDRRVRGASVYALSSQGATTEAARWLAERENAADLVGGVSLEDKDGLLASVLLDLSQTATIEASLEAGSRLLASLGTVGELHKARVQQAGFVVLKSPDIPSVLVETAFISNPEEERRLRSSQHQRKLAKAVLQGVREYFRRQAPPGTWLAESKHVIERGDTLSGIAQHYNVPIKRLRLANGLDRDLIRVGQILDIPVDSEG